jgi:PAS domain S-box-containing protein
VSAEGGVNSVRGKRGGSSAGLDSPSLVDILLVDDRPENLIALEAVLSMPGYRLAKAGSGDEALKYLLDHEPALILMDVQMPELDGYETASIIKKSERTRYIPIIFITAISKDERFVSRGYEQGAVDYIYKPFDAQILKSKVAVFADLYRKNEALLRAERLLRENEKKERQRTLAQLELKTLRREQEQQRKYRDLVDGINHGIVWSADPDTLSFSFVSTSAGELSGYPAELWKDDPVFLRKHHHPEDWPFTQRKIAEALESGEDTRFEHRMLKSDGAVLWLHTALRVRANESGGRELRGLSVDISKIKAAEQVLERNRERAEFLAQAGLRLAQTLEPEEVSERLLELSVPRLARWAVVFLEGSECRDSICLGQFANQAEASSVRLLAEALRDQGARVARGLNGGAVHLAPGEPLPGIGSIAGVDELLAAPRVLVPLRSKRSISGFILQRLNDEEDFLLAQDLAVRALSAIENASLYHVAQAAVRARDEFLSIASHELKTPLTPLKLQTQGLMRTLNQGTLSEVKPERIVKMVQTSERQITRLSRLIEDLLDISRINIGRLKISPEEFDLAELIHEVIDRFSEQVLESGCTIRLSMADRVPVRLDRFRIEQVLVNLLTNAIKYAPGKPIEVQVVSEKDRLLVSFRDHGIGIAQADQARIFERFERAVSASHFAGMGLGLYIVAQILRAHQGRIEVQSELGSGSLFRVEMPARVTVTEPEVGEGPSVEAG